MTDRRIVFVVFDGFQPLDLTGPHEVFHSAGGYACEVLATRAGPVRSVSGLVMHAAHGVTDLDPAGTDTLVVVGGRGVERAREHPKVSVDCDPIFVRDGRVWTSAGVTAGMDLALALVEDDLGRGVAHEVARGLVLFLRRPGGQSQFSVALWSRQPATDPVRAAVGAIHADPGARHDIAGLAAHAGLSPRHLQRRFTAELGVPPTAYVERMRVEAAQRALTDGDEPVEAIARRYGFTTAETLRRTFHRRLGVAPSDYRARFRSATGALADLAEEGKSA